MRAKPVFVLPLLAVLLVPVIPSAYSQVAGAAKALRTKYLDAGTFVLVFERGNKQTMASGTAMLCQTEFRAPPSLSQVVY